jgi:hypothetical protein
MPENYNDQTGNFADWDRDTGPAETGPSQSTTLDLLPQGAGFEAQSTPAKKDPWRVAAAALIIAFGACLIAAIQFATQTDQKTTQRDYIQYWVIGQQLIHGADPYDVAALTQLEEKAGLGSDLPRISLSPPAVFFLMLMLGLVSPKTGYILWWFLQMGCLSVALWLLWRMNGRPDNRIHLFGYIFTPVLICLATGQLGIYLLLGIVLFLYFNETRPTLAGAALLPCALKPHLFLVFALVLMSWVVYRKAFRILLGFLASLTASCALVYCFDPHVWSQYFDKMRVTRVMQVYIPTFGDSLRFLVDRNSVWLQFLPALAGCVWALWYFLTRRERWDWINHGLLLILVSDVCAPYGFFNDECILLPLILVGLYRAVDFKRAFLLFAVLNGVALIEVWAGADMGSPYYLWSVPAWLAWYFYANGKWVTASQTNRENATAETSGQAG